MQPKAARSERENALRGGEDPSACQLVGCANRARVNERTHRVADTLEEEEQEEAGDAAVARTERGAEAARDARDAVHAQQECSIDETEERSAEKTPACEGELAECEHEARARVTNAHALVDEVFHSEGGDAHLRAAAHVRVI